jgi:hypothetical protein
MPARYIPGFELYKDQVLATLQKIPYSTPSSTPRPVSAPQQEIVKP